MVLPSIRCIYQLSYAWPAVAARLSLSLSLFLSVCLLRACFNRFRFDDTKNFRVKVAGDASPRESERRLFSRTKMEALNRLQDTVCGTIRESSESRDDYRLPMKFTATWTNINEVGYFGFTIIFRRLRQLLYFCLPSAAPPNR